MSGAFGPLVYKAKKMDEEEDISGVDARELTVSDYSRRCAEQDPGQQIFLSEMSDKLLSLLDGASREVIKKRFGFGQQEAMTQSQIAASMGITLSQVRKLETLSYKAMCRRSLWMWHLILERREVYDY